MDFIPFPKTANFECGPSSAAEGGIAQNFGLDFSMKGNFTFTWSQGVILNNLLKIYNIIFLI